jgi:hypothetical protein
MVGDLDGDGDVDIADAALFGPNFGKFGWGAYTVFAQATDDDGTWSAETSVKVEPAASGGGEPLSHSSIGADETAQRTIAPLSVSEPVSEPDSDETIKAASGTSIASTQESAQPQVVTSSAVAGGTGENTGALRQLAFDDRLRRMEMLQNRVDRMRIDAAPDPADADVSPAGADPVDMGSGGFGQRESRAFFDPGDSSGAASWADGFLNNLAEYEEEQNEDDAIAIDPFADEETDLSEGDDWLTGWLVGDDKAAK